MTDSCFKINLANTILNNGVTSRKLKTLIATPVRSKKGSGADPSWELLLRLVDAAILHAPREDRQLHVPATTMVRNMW